MSQSDDTGYKTFVASAAIAKYARVTLASTGLIETAGLAVKEIGTATNAAFAAGDRVTVKLRSAPGTHKMIAVEALAIGALVYTEAGGKVQDTAEATAFQVGHCVDAVAPTADGDIVEVLYNNHGDTAAQ
jgi:hypothetical protein